MYKLVKFYIQNKRICLTIFGIVLLFIVLQILNKTTIENRKNTNLNSANDSNSTTSTVKQNGYSAISDAKVPETKLEKNIETINIFVEYCNNQNTQEAYDLLSKECKELLFPTINDFINNYYKKVFTEKRMCDTEIWIANDNRYTYKARLIGDILSAGKLIDSDAIYDYITIVESEEGEERLNINSYVGRKIINSEGSIEGVGVEVISKDIYMDYEIYNIKVSNTSQNTILLDSKLNTDTVYIQDINNLKYYALLYENDISRLKILTDQAKNLSIKFNKLYNPSREIKTMNFNNIVMDYDKDKNEYENIKEISINL